MPVILGTIASQRTASGIFGPLSINWTYAWWASDPSWTPPANGAAVTSWRNAGSDGTAATGTTHPLYSTGYTSLNTQPAVTYDGNQFLQAVSGTTLTQPYHWYIVGYEIDDARNDHSITDSNSSRCLIRIKSSTQMLVYAGSVVSFGSATFGGYQMAALLDGASSEVRVNGQIYSGLNPGTGSHNFPYVGCDLNGSNPILGALVFLGGKDAPLTSGELDDLSGWASTLYGVPAL